MPCDTPNERLTEMVVVHELGQHGAGKRLLHMRIHRARLHGPVPA